LVILQYILHNIVKNFFLARSPNIFNKTNSLLDYYDNKKAIGENL